jgi:hypothetical protein
VPVVVLWPIGLVGVPVGQPDEYEEPAVSPVVSAEQVAVETVALLQDELLYPGVEHSEGGCYYSPDPG